jgi:hypothetical protein
VLGAFDTGQLEVDPTVVGDQVLHIQHDLCIALVCVCCDSLQTITMILVDDGGLGVQDERHSQETLLRLLALRNTHLEIPPGRNLEAYFDPFDLWRDSVSAALPWTWVVFWELAYQLITAMCLHCGVNEGQTRASYHIYR